MTKNRNENKFIQFIKLPVQLYKVAASILIAFGLYAIIQYSMPHEKNSLLSSGDTNIIYKTDTIYARLVDTVNIIKTKTVYILQKAENFTSGKILSNVKIDYDCKKEICPDEVVEIKELTFNNNISRDTLLKDFIVSLK
jgi:hypothetical protein